jgi:hypothetical protein
MSPKRPQPRTKGDCQPNAPKRPQAKHIRR